jgi:glucan phosphoethanolaminetransferase (alkaline phosphatase superfamily)
MICFMGVSSNELIFLLILYFVLLAITFYQVMNEHKEPLIKIAKAALAIFLPFAGIALIWSEVLIRTIVSRKHSI